MRRLFAKFYQQTPKATALLLCLWLSGAVCLLNCNLVTVQAGESVEIESVVDESLPPCHRQATQNESPEQEDKSRASLADAPNPLPMSCCPFFTATLEQAKHFRFAKVAAAQPAQIRLLPPVVEPQRESVFQPDYKPPPQSRGSTYLLNCVFLI